MSGTLKRIAGPAYLPNSVGNLYTPPASTIYTVIKHIHFFNTTASPVTISIYIGVTGGSAGGTELFFNFSIVANSSYDYYTQTKMLSTDFLTGVCSAASAVTYTIDGEQGVV